MIVTCCLGLLGYWIIISYSVNILDVLPQVIQARLPYVVMAFVNLGFVLLMYICGAILYSKWVKAQPKLLLLIACVALCSGILLHAMVYGIVLFVPVPYSLLGAYHITFRIFPGIDSVPFASNILFCYLFGMLVHLFSPQVILAIFVCICAIKRYMKLKCENCNC